jgi:hypothetical protein
MSLNELDALAHEHGGWITEATGTPLARRSADQEDE